MVVQPISPHIVKRGDTSMSDQNYAMTKKYGNTTVHFVAPSPLTHEEEEKILNEFHYAGWAIWNSLSTEEKLQINNDALQRKQEK